MLFPCWFPLTFQLKKQSLHINKFSVFIYMLMKDASLKQRVPCITCISIFWAFSAGKKCALHTGKYRNSDNYNNHKIKIIMIIFLQSFILNLLGVHETNKLQLYVEILLISRYQRHVNKKNFNNNLIYFSYPTGKLPSDFS